ncbi:MAG: MDR family MFS transporter, partial [Eggerthellaceae bacterium]|nr:MDR family MFS transporter [Eggerthellaceae bacterium]
MGLGISKQQLRMVAVLLSGTLIAVLNMTLLTPALPTIMNDMGVNQTTVQWLTSGYALVEAVVIPLAAYMIGRFSTRRLFIGGILLFAAGSLTAALAPVFWVILAGRMMQAAATGIIMPMVSSIILLVFPREKRGSAMGIVGLIIGFAPAIGPSLSGLVVDHIGWRALFGIVTTLALVIAFTASRILVNFDNFKRTKFDAPSVVLSTLGLLSLLYGFSTFSSAENHAVTAALIVVGAALIGVYARRQLTLDTPMLHLDILHVRQYRTVVCIIAIFQAALVGMETIMPLYIQGVLGHSATVSGLTLLPGPVIGAVVGVLAGRLFDRDGVRRPVLAGSIFLIAGAVGLFMLRIDTPVPLVAVAYALISVGMQFTMTPMNTWGVNSLPNSKVSHAQSTSNTVNQVGTSFGTAILVSISAAVSGVVGSSEAGAALSATEVTFVGYHAAFAGTAALLIVALVCIYVFVRDKKGEARKATQSNADGASGAEGAPTGTDAYAEIAANAGIASAENASTGERPTEGAATSASPAAPDFPASP